MPPLAHVWIVQAALAQAQHEGVTAGTISDKPHGQVEGRR
jgi:hypothetical protein